jgi:hypothetical protein
MRTGMNAWSPGLGLTWPRVVGSLSPRRRLLGTTRVETENLSRIGRAELLGQDLDARTDARSRDRQPF